MIPYEKYHGTGNDFVVVDAGHHVPDRAAFAATVCDRDTGVHAGPDGRGTAGDGDDAADLDAPGAEAAADGAGPGAADGGRVGADGVLFCHLEPDFRPPRVVMTLVQPDGSTASMCGNGARCAAHWAARRTGSGDLMIDTPAGTRRATVDGEAATVEMGRPCFDPGAVPVAGTEPLVEADVGDLVVTAVNTGVPHAVAVVPDVAAVDLDAVAPAVRHADAFPEGANVTLAARRPSGGFDQRTYERGVEGETRSCGTGAVAVAAVARRLGLVDDDAVAVHPPGGRLSVAIDDRGVARLTGPVARSFDGEAEPVPARPVDA